MHAYRALHGSAGEGHAVCRTMHVGWVERPGATFPGRAGTSAGVPARRSLSFAPRGADSPPGEHPTGVQSAPVRLGSGTGFGLPLPSAWALARVSGCRSGPPGAGTSFGLPLRSARALGRVSACRSGPLGLWREYLATRPRLSGEWRFWSAMARVSAHSRGVAGRVRRFSSFANRRRGTPAALPDAGRAWRVTKGPRAARCRPGFGHGGGPARGRRGSGRSGSG